MNASKILLALLILVSPSPRIARASDDPPPSEGATIGLTATAPVHVVLTNGETLEARCVQPAPFDMIAVIPIDGSLPRYFPPVRIRAVLDASGQDQTAKAVDRRDTVGTPPPRPAPIERPPKPLRVGPRSVTKSFLITETSYLGRIGLRDRGEHDLWGYLGFDLGVMNNVSDRTAVGYGGFCGFASDYANAGVRLRLRRWLTTTMNIEIAPGVVLAEGRTRSKPVHPGYSLQTSWSPSRYLTLTAEAFRLRRRDYSSDARYRYWDANETRDTGLMLGVKLGQWPGAAGAAIVGLAAVGYGMERAGNAP